MITLAFAFPAGGRYHATAWGTQVNEGVPEWPPSPWRLCRALCATWFHKGHDLAGEPEFRALIKKLLDAPPPKYSLPPYTEAHTRHFMPYKKGKAESKTKVFDTFVQVMPSPEDTGYENALTVEWTVELDEAQTLLLDALLQRMNYLGRAESLVSARIVENSSLEKDSETLVQPVSPERAFNPEEDELVRLLCPEQEADFQAWKEAYAQTEEGKKQRKKDFKAPESRFDCLLLDTDDWRSTGWTHPPGSRWIVFTKPHQKTTPVARSQPKEKTPLPTVALFAVAGKVIPPLTKAISIGGRVHESLVKISDGQTVFTGMDGDKPATGHQHAHYLCYSDDPRGRVTSIAVYAPMGFDARARAALGQLRHVWAENGGHLHLALMGLAREEDFKANLAPGDTWRKLPFFQESTVWESYTPFVPTRHTKRRANGDPKIDPENGLAIGSAEHDLLRLLKEAGHPTAEIELVPKNDIQIPWLKFQVRRRSGNGARAGNRGYGLRVKFDEPVRGPIAMGYGAHFGLGLFIPVIDQPNA